MKHLKEALLIIVGAIAFGAIHHFATKLAEINFRDTALLFGFLIVVAVGLATVKLVDQINELYRGMSPRVSYFAIDDRRGRDKMFEDIKTIIREAKEEILALNSFAEEWPHDKETPKHRESYFQTLIDVSRRVPYVRIVQIDENKSIRDLFADSYIKHFKAMVKERKRRGKDIQLLRVPPKYPSTFLIIDGKYLIWQLTEIIPSEAYSGSPQEHSKKKRFRVRGIVIVHDPLKYFIKNFIDTFKMTLQHERSIEDADLEPPTDN